jgi:hypothetical protein
MIWGQLDSVKHELQQEKLKNKYLTVQKSFAYLPTKIVDGRWAWLCNLYYIPPIYKEKRDGRWHYYKWSSVVFGHNAYYIDKERAEEICQNARKQEL